MDIPYPDIAQNQKEIGAPQGSWPIPISILDKDAAKPRRVPSKMLGDVVSCWRFVTRFSEALSLTPFTLLQLEEALTYKMQDEASMDRGLLYNSKKGRLVDEVFQSLLTILLNEEVAEETEDLKTNVGNRSTHTRGGKLARHSLIFVDNKMQLN